MRGITRLGSYGRQGGRYGRIDDKEIEKEMLNELEDNNIDALSESEYSYYMNKYGNKFLKVYVNQADINNKDYIYRVKNTIDNISFMGGVDLAKVYEVVEHDKFIDVLGHIIIHSVMYDCELGLSEDVVERILSNDKIQSSLKIQAINSIGEILNKFEYLGDLDKVLQGSTIDDILDDGLNIQNYIGESYLPGHQTKVQNFNECALKINEREKENNEDTPFWDKGHIIGYVGGEPERKDENDSE